MRFYQKRYDEAARHLEKVYKLDPTFEESNLFHSCLGRTYLALGRHMDALNHLSRAYELFHKRIDFLKEDTEQQEFLDTLNAFTHVLRITDHAEHAQAIAHEAAEYSMRLKKTSGSE